MKKEEGEYKREETYSKVLLGGGGIWILRKKRKEKRDTL